MLAIEADMEDEVDRPAGQFLQFVSLVEVPYFYVWNVSEGFEQSGRRAPFDVHGIS